MGESAATICAEILRGEPRPAKLVNPLVPEELQRVIGKALEKNDCFNLACSRDRGLRTAGFCRHDNRLGAGAGYDLALRQRAMWGESERNDSDSAKRDMAPKKINWIEFEKLRSTPNIISSANMLQVQICDW
jgi:hypothetical protein